jgi:hypothetical protein
MKTIELVSEKLSHYDSDNDPNTRRILKPSDKLKDGQAFGHISGSSYLHDTLSNRHLLETLGRMHQIEFMIKRSNN